MASSLHIAPKSRRESAASASTSTTGNPDFFSPLQPPTPPTSPATGITVDQKQLDAQSAALFEQLQKEALLQRKRAGTEGGNDSSEQRFANQRSSTKFFVDENQRRNKINNADQSKKKKHIDAASSDLLPASSGGGDGAQQRNQHIPKSEAFTIIPPGRAFLSRCSEGADSEAAKARWLSVKTLVAKSSSNAAVFPQSTADQIARDAILNEIEMRGVGRHFGRTAAKYSMKRKSLLRPALTEEEQHHLVQQRLQFSPAQQQVSSSQQQEKGRRGRSNSKNNANATAASASVGYPNPYSTVIFNRRIAVSQVNENRHTDAEKRANEFLNHRQRLLSVRNTVCHNKFFVGKIKESALHKKKINELHMRQLLADSRRLQLQQAMTSRLYQLGMLRKEKSFNAVHMKRAQLLGLQ